MTFVILQAPNQGYYWLIKATSNKHFELLDAGFSELESGEYEEMRDKINFLEWLDATDGGTKHLITLKRGDSYSYQTEEDLHKLLDMNPNFFEEYQIVDGHDWLGKY